MFGFKKRIQRLALIFILYLFTRKVNKLWGKSIFNISLLVQKLTNEVISL